MPKASLLKRINPLRRDKLARLRETKTARRPQLGDISGWLALSRMERDAARKAREAGELVLADEHTGNAIAHSLRAELIRRKMRQGRN